MKSAGKYGKMVPLCKQSKKARRAFYAQKRGGFSGVQPVTRIVPDGTRYNRSKEKQAMQREANESAAAAGWQKPR